MRVICPHCQTIYQLQGLDPDVLLICHRCGTEFGLGEQPDSAQDIGAASLIDQQTPDMFDSLPSRSASGQQAANNMGQNIFPGRALPEENLSPPAHEPAAESIGAADFLAAGDIAALQPATSIKSVSPDNAAEEQTDDLHVHGSAIIPAQEAWPVDPAATAPSAAAGTTDEQTVTFAGKRDDFRAGPPPRAKARIMPWLISVILLIAASGFWVNHKAWLDDPWLRSVLMNAGIKMQIRDKDWRVEPDSVSAVWIERKAGETALVITGEVHSLLQTALLPPLIHVTLYARDNPDEIIAERDEIITRPPLMQAIRQAPYTPPLRDDTPITALARRGFVLVLENLPQNAGNFTLEARARQ